MNSYQMVLHRPVEPAPFCGNYDTKVGSSVGEVVSELPAQQKLNYNRPSHSLSRITTASEFWVDGNKHKQSPLPAVGVNRFGLRALY